jgi:hypothetical protein
MRGAAMPIGDPSGRIPMPPIRGRKPHAAGNERAAAGVAQAGGVTELGRYLRGLIGVGARTRVRGGTN